MVSVESGGPAAQAGIQRGDLVISINEQKVASIDDLHRFLTKWPIGQPVRITVIRGKEKKEFEVTPSELQ